MFRTSLIRRQQGVLLLIAILVPCLVFVALGWRMIEQERQLQGTRRAEEQLQSVRQELVALLDKIKVEEMRRVVSGSDGGESAENLQEDIVFTGALKEGRLQLPWEDRSETRQFKELMKVPDFYAAIRKAEIEELRAHNYASAVTLYRQAMEEVASQPSQQAYARMLLARTLDKLRGAAEGPRNVTGGRAEYERLLASPPDLVDGNGMPLFLFAALPLAEALRVEASPDGGAAPRSGDGTDRKQLLESIQLAFSRKRRLPPTALYLVRDIARELQAPDLEGRAAEAIRDAELAEEAQSDSAMLIALAGSREPTWISHGDLLVSVTPPLGTLDRLVVAVRTAGIAARLSPPRSIHVAGITEAAGVAMGDTFPRLRLVLPQPDPRETNTRQMVLTFALVLAFALALLAGYLVHRDAQRSLRHAELRSQFVSSVTHELKTPLTAIRMFTETLQLDEEVDQQTRSEYLHTILHESERLSRLVDNVLDFGSIERGKKIYRFRPLRLHEVVERAALTIQYPLEQAGFILDASVDRDLPPVAADSDALEQAILNLLTNAMKYSGESRKIRLALDRGNGYGRIRVTDHGIGIPPHAQGRIFERFYRAPVAENQHIPGAGLGLTLVAHIVKAHGGKVEVSSSAGAGSTFTILLPFSKAEPVDGLRSNA